MDANPATEKCYTTSTLCAVAGCEVITFQKWRQRNGLFPETVSARGWSRFSIVDICVVRAIVALTAGGIPAGEAVEISQKHLRIAFDVRLKGETYSPYGYLFRAKAGGEGWHLMHANDDTKLADVLGKIGDRYAGDVGTVIDCHAIISHVLDTLIALKPETVAQPGTALRIIARTMADIFSPEKNPPKYDDDAKPASPKPRTKRGPRKGRQK